MSLAEMRAELRELRKSHPEHMAVSKMRKADVSSMIQKLKVGREETPAAAMGVAPARLYKSAVHSVKEAKAAEFPLEAVDAPKSMKAAPKAKKEMPVKKAKEAKDVMVTERAAPAKKPRAKKPE